MSGQSNLSEKNIHTTVEKVQEALLESDVPYDVVEAFIAEIKKQVIGKKVLRNLKPYEHFMAIVKETLVSFLSSGHNVSEKIIEQPGIIMFIGLQGSGKTTTIGKLIHLIQKKNNKKRILAASVDFYRPAALDQLEIVAATNHVSLYRATSNNPVQAAQEIVSYYYNNRFDYLLLDTAGRLHIDEKMMKELVDIDKKIKPNKKLLILDAMTGQESLAIASMFNTAIAFNGAILTKLDSNTHAGSALAFAYRLQKPLVLVGTGEKSHEYELFKPDRIAQRLLGMGDLATLAEQAEAVIKEDEQDRIAKAFQSGNITLQDFADHIGMMDRLGPLSRVMRMIPGMASISQEQFIEGQEELNRFKVIINSMTLKERCNPKIIQKSRKKRIAGGAGVAVNNVTLLLERFAQMKQFVKLMKGMKGFPRLF